MDTRTASLARTLVRLVLIVLSLTPSSFSSAQGSPKAKPVYPADIDGNGFVNGDDSDLFLHWFQSGDLRADFDHNGFVNGEDFDAFTHSFERGEFVATTYTINSALIEEQGGILQLTCTGPTPAHSGPLNPYVPLLSGKSRSLSTGHRFQFMGSAQKSSAGTTTLILRFAIDPSTRVPFTGASSGITFSADSGFLIDRYGNTVGGAMGLTVDNLSLVTSLGLPHPTPFTTRPSGSVEYFVNWKDGNDTTGTGTLASPFKTKRKAALALAANGHLTDGSFISVVTDGTSAYDEIISGSNQYVRVNLGGPSPWQRGMIRPVNPSGVFVNSFRNKTFITPGGSDNSRTVFVRTGGSDSEGISLATNQLIYGQHVESSDMSDECKHAAFSYNQPVDTFMFWECLARGLQSGTIVQDASGNAVMKNVVSYNNTYDKIFDTDPTGTESGHAIAVFVDGTSGRNSFYEDVFTDCGYNEASLQEGDIFGRPIYVSDSSAGGGPSSIVGCICYNSADNFAQQRTGGWYFGNRNDRSPMDVYGGNAWGWNASCNVASRLRNADAVGSPADERGQGLFANGSTNPTDAPSRIHNNVATGLLPGSIDNFNNRSFGESGTQTGCTIQIDHNVGNNLGPLIAHLPKPGNVYEDGGQPFDCLFEDNINTNTSGSELHAVSVGMIPSGGMAWLRGVNNCLVTSNAAKFGFVDQTGTDYTKAAWEAVATSFITTDTTAPAFVDNTRTILTHLQTTSELSGLSESQCYDVIRNRTMGTRPSWLDWKAAWEWISTGWVDPAKVRSPSLMDRKGVTPGFAEMTFGGAPMSTPTLLSTKTTSSSISFTFSEAITAGAGIVGAIVLGRSRGTIPLRGLTPTIVGATLTLAFTGVINNAERLTAWLDSDSVRSASTTTPNAPFLVPVTNTSATAPAATNLNSLNLPMWGRGLFIPNTQAVFQVIGDSINNWDAENGIGKFWLENLPCPWNSWNVPAGSGSSHTTGASYHGGGNVASATFRGPSKANPASGPETWNDGSTAISPVPGVDLVLTAGTPGSFLNQISSSNLTSSSFKWTRTVNYAAGGASFPTEYALALYDTAQGCTLVRGRGGPGTYPVNAYLNKASTNTIRPLIIGQSDSTVVGTGDRTTIIYSDTAVITGATDNKVMIFPGKYTIKNTVGVQFSAPIGGGGWDTSHHQRTDFFTDAALDNWLTVNGFPTHCVLWLGQNLTSPQATDLLAGNGASYSAGLVAVMKRYNDSAVRLGKPAIKWLLVTPYKTGYSQLQNETRAEVGRALAAANPSTIAWVNLYKLAGGESMPTDFTYLADGVHPGPTIGQPTAMGKPFFVQCIFREIMRAMTLSSFRHVDHFDFAFAAGLVPDNLYRIGTPANISTSGGAMVASGTTQVFVHDRGTDHVYSDHSTEVKITASTAATTGLVTLYTRYTHDTCNYQVEWNILTGAWAVRMGTGVAIASGTGLTYAANDVLKLTAVRTGTSTVLTASRNGSAFSTTTLTAAQALASCGLAGIKFTIGTGAISIGYIDAAPAGDFAYPGLTYAGRAPKPAAAGELDNLVVYSETYASAEPENQGKVVAALFNNAGQFPDWRGFADTYLWPTLNAYPQVKKAGIRGVGGHNNSVGIRPGATYTTDAAPTPGQCLVQVFSMAVNYFYRTTATSGFTTVIKDGRLAYGYLTMLFELGERLNELFVYGSAFPSGTKVTGSAGGTPVAYPSTPEAFAMWIWDALTVSETLRLIDGGTITPCFDTQICDPGTVPGGAGRPSENDVNFAFTEWLKGLTLNFAIEPPPEYGAAGGTSENMRDYYASTSTGSRIGIIGNTFPTLPSQISPDPAQDLIERGRIKPDRYFNPSMYAPNQRQHCWVTGIWSNTTARLARATQLLREPVNIIWFEYGNMSTPQILALHQAALSTTSSLHDNRSRIRGERF